MDSPCEVPDSVKGFILFHFLRKQKISQYNSIISHTKYISLVIYFTCYKLKEVRMAESKLRELSIDLYNRCGTIRRILVASINTAKENLQKEKINSKSKPNISV